VNHSLGQSMRMQGRRMLLALVAVLCLVVMAIADKKRSRQDGLQASISSITAGEGNVHLTLFGRSFLWDNQAAQKIPPAMPHAELNYGVWDFADITVGFNPMAYSLQTGSFYLRTMVTTPDTKNLRLVGFGLQTELKRNLMKDFPSNGFRVSNEGFGPEGYVFGGTGLFQSAKLTLAADLEAIRISSWLPFKLYANAGLEFPILGSAVEDDNARLAEEKAMEIATQSTAIVPLSLGLQFKTFNTDFFVEVETQPFMRHAQRFVLGWLQGEEPNPNVRFDMIGKAFDVHVMESPSYFNTGARLKYAGGLELQGGFAWQLSSERGARLGPCTRLNNCLDGASDGFSPFFPQWKVFGQIRYPLRFIQPSSELYRSFLLRRYQDNRKRLDVDQTLRTTQEETGLTEEERRLKRLMERRQEAHDNALDLQ
jgi:hypothetical protein